VTVLAAGALGAAALAAPRALAAAGGAGLAWTVGVAVLPAASLVLLELLWRPAAVLGAGQWAAHAMAVAAALTLFAERLARADAPDRRRAAVATLGALTMVSFALIVVLSAAALTLALAAMVLFAAVLDRRFGLPLLAVFVQAGAAVLGWRLFVDPGLGWALDAPLGELVLAHGGTIALLAAARAVLTARARPGALVAAEAAAWSFAAVLAAALVVRALAPAHQDSHWGVSLVGLVWLIAALAQLHLMKAAGALQLPRLVLALVFALPAMAFGLVAAGPLNPLFDPGETVLGPPILDTLFLAYGLPALALAAAAARFGHLPPAARIAGAALAGALGALWLGLEIRRAWQGDVIALPGVLDGELYSYTVAMLVVSVVLLFAAFARRSVAVRRLAMAGIGLTVAKVFLVDMSGLAGLFRVASFLGLGLSLAGLAWVNRLMTRQWETRRPGQ
jgi:uncharacterized membrane protein